MTVNDNNAPQSDPVTAACLRDLDEIAKADLPELSARWGKIVADLRASLQKLKPLMTTRQLMAAAEWSADQARVGGVFQRLMQIAEQMRNPK